jgi:hypothetical protein
MATAHVGHGAPGGDASGNGLERRGEGAGMDVEALGGGKLGEDREGGGEGSIHDT